MTGAVIDWTHTSFGCILTLSLDQIMLSTQLLPRLTPEQKGWSERKSGWFICRYTHPLMYLHCQSRVEGRNPIDVNTCLSISVDNSTTAGRAQGTAFTGSRSSEDIAVLAYCLVGSVQS